MCFPFIQKSAKCFAKRHYFIDIWRNICLMFCQIAIFYLVLAKHLTGYATHRKKTRGS